MRHDSQLVEWLVCPGCGNDEFDIMDIPQPVSGVNGYVTCPECGHTGVVSN